MPFLEVVSGGLRFISSYGVDLNLYILRGACSTHRIYFACIKKGINYSHYRFNRVLSLFHSEIPESEEHREYAQSGCILRIFFCLSSFSWGRFFKQVINTRFFGDLRILTVYLLFFLGWWIQITPHWTLHEEKD